MDVTEAARRTAILATLKARVSEAYELSRADCAEIMDNGDRKAAQLDGAKLGNVIKTNERTTAKVTDPDAFLAWVRANHPSEITEAVRSAFQSKILTDAKHYGQAVDVTSGELIPGVSVDVAEGYVRVDAADDAAEAIAARWNEASRYVPELPGGAS